ncbi:ribonuclease Z [Geosmithia morbida]|uniref:Ribonuclease Z n=1 Tax=Geosmithia morbida TaxID=1094350 RepID=A0A9P5D4Z8_9HYPO|nr:ribonuclease Z [Geosmithia morbida]KAF4121999.1 ribonuclease Z [Geosmithia morbida]
MSSAPTFATPLVQSTRSSILQYTFPKPHHNLVLTGRSRAAWHTSFVIPQLDVLLDAGLCVNKLRPRNVFITHGHSDHTLVTPAFVQTQDPPDVYCPSEVEPVLEGYIVAHKRLDKGGVVPEGVAVNHRHRMHGVRHGTVVDLGSQAGITVTAFDCDHTVPCLGYLFSSTTRRLRAEYVGLPAAEIKRIRHEVGGADNMTAPFTRPVFAFLGDTTAATLAAAPDWLAEGEGIPVVITECSFLRDEHYAQAQKTKHTAWKDLEPVVRRWPRTTFVLTHFSMRYSDREVVDFFKGLDHCPSNIVIWADGEA